MEDSEQEERANSKETEIVLESLTYAGDFG